MSAATKREQRRSSLRQLIAGVSSKPLVLVDIENIAVGAQNPSLVEQRVAELNALLPAAATVRVAARPSAAPIVWFAAGAEHWRRLPPRTGKDGSDHALLETLDEPPPTGCDGLVIASGDHAFVEAIDLVAMPTIVLSVRRSTSRELVARADWVAYLESYRSLPYQPATPKKRRCRAAALRPTDCTAQSDLLDLRDDIEPYGLADQKAA